jgi:hypothetical protein
MIVIESDHLAMPPSAHFAARPRGVALRVFPERRRDHDRFVGILTPRAANLQLLGKATLFVGFERRQTAPFGHFRTAPDYVSFAQHAAQNAPEAL